MAEMEDKMRWFVSYKDGPSLEVSAGKASESIDLFGITYGDGRTEGSLTGGNPMQFSLSGLDKCVTAGDGGVYYVGDLFDKGNGKGNGKQ